MLHKCYLRKGAVYVPTVVNQGVARYMDVEPVTVVPVTDTEKLRDALRTTISKENRFVAPTVEDARKPAVVLKYTGDKSWRALVRNASVWAIATTRDGKYEIAGHRIHEKGYWEEDPKQTIQFPAGAGVDEVVDRIVVILQKAARNDVGE
jgi:hypothetical protein